MLHIWSMNLRHAGVAPTGVKILVSVQFAFLNREWRGKERNHFGDLLYAKKGSKCAAHLEAKNVPNVLAGVVFVHVFDGFAQF